MGMTLNLKQEIDDEKELKETSAGKKAHEFAKEQRSLLQRLLQSGDSPRVANGVPNILLLKAESQGRDRELLEGAIEELIKEEQEWDNQ
jgi:hypothetical protein